MTSRERTLAVLLSGLIGLTVLGGAGYLLVYLPLSDKAAEARKLESDIADREARLIAVQKNRPRLEATLKRSLPSDPDVARQEYDAAIARLLRDARVPVTAYSVRPRQVDGKAAPEIAPKKPAYTRIALEVNLKKVDFATLIDVLQRYYRLNLLQQITKFTVKRLEEGTAAASRRGGSGGFSAGQGADKPDLDVTIVTEAIILDGAEPRRSLLPVSSGFGAAGGGLEYGALTQSPEQARGLAPLQLARVLAAMDRSYPAMLAKDVFHGPIPERPSTPPAPPKEDTSEFIRLTGVGRNPDGTGLAFIEDVASRQEYDVELTRVKGKLTAKVVKHYFVGGRKKSWPAEVELDISDTSSSTARKFKVVGIDPEAMALLLVALDDKGEGKDAKPEAKGPGGLNSGARKGPTAGSAKAPAGVAVGGGVVAGLPAETIYAWKAGEPLSSVHALSAAEAVKAVARATAADAPVGGEKAVPVSATQPAPEAQTAVAGDRDD